MESDSMYDRVKPKRFKQMPEKDLKLIVDALLGGESKSRVEISEKIAGQHLTVKCLFDVNRPKQSRVRVFTKDSILRGGKGKNGRKASWGRSFTQSLFSLFSREPELSRDLFKSEVGNYHVWSFEMANPKTNHDFIRYKNYETVYCEYTGFLTSDMIDAIQPFLPKRVKLLGKEDVKVNISSLTHKFKAAFPDIVNSLRIDEENEDDNSLVFPANEESDNFHLKRFRKKMKGKMKRKKNVLRDRKKLKKRLGDFVERTIVSRVDNQSPVEGVVFKVYDEKFKSYREYKLQTNTYLRLQRGQMPLYSLLKLGRKEKKVLLKYPTKPIDVIQHHFKKLNFHPIIDRNQSLSLSQTLQKFLAKGTKDNKQFDDSDYRVWFTPKQAKKLSMLAIKNPSFVFKKLHKKVKGKKLK